MLSSRFFWKLYLAFAGLVLVTVTATGFLVHQQLSASLLTDVETRLRDIATVLIPYSTEVFKRADPKAHVLDQDGYRIDPVVQAEVVRMGQRTETRITLVAPDGIVVADSDEDPAVMDNHGTRPEIVASRTNPYGVSRRFSRTVQQSLLYVAITIREGDEVVGTVRTSIPLVDVDAQLAALRNTIALGATLGILSALAVGLFVARRITAPVAQMTQVAEALRAGEYDQRIDDIGGDEIGMLGETLNRLADELTERIAVLAEQRAQLGAMIAGLQEAVFAIDESSRLIFHNRAASQTFNFPEEATDASLWDFVSDPGIAELCDQARAAGSRARREIALIRDGEEIVLDARATSFESEGQQGVVVVLHDVSNLRRLERVRTEFVANVSHELKTPLTSIRGYVETLLGGAIHDDTNNLRFLGKIEQQVDRLSALVSDLLSLARIEATEPRSTLEHVDWRSVIEAVVESYREAGKLQDHTCEFEVPEAPVFIEGNVEAMTQVLDNLLDNAIKYTPAGGTITVRTYRDSGQAVMEVEDTGIGMSILDRTRIFERFFRADRARSRDTGGTGLGLAIVKHLVQGMGGEIRVASELGKGSRFAVWVPGVG